MNMKRIHMSKCRLAVLMETVAASAAAFGFVCEVSPQGQSLEAALAKARASGEAVREIVLADGDYFFAKPIELGPKDSGLVIRAAHDGKAVLWGGTEIAGWKREGDRFVAADVPEVKDGTWDFRALFVNGRMAELACYPSATNTLENLGAWKGRARAAIEGYFDIKPTEAELLEMPYREGDLPDVFDPRDASVRLYHMWGASLVRVASNDVANGILHFSSKMTYAAGAFGKRAYQVLGIREGLTHPGTWYLDHQSGKVVYWPKSGEKIADLRAVAPRMNTVISIRGDKSGRAKDIRLEGLMLTGTDAPCMTPSFGGYATPAALEVEKADGCSFERIVIRAVGAIGLKAGSAAHLRLASSSVTDCGSAALCVYTDDSTYVSNRLLRVGLNYLSACAVTFGGERSRFAGNEISDSPYSGIILRGRGNVIEGNHISRVMRTLHDGAAVYGNMCDTVIRGNVVRDVVEFGSGYGASAFYCDETSVGNVIENNVTVGVPMPCHQHVVRDVCVRGNTFITDGDMKISFANSVGCTFADNVLVSGGRIVQSAACGTSVTNWSGNRAWSRAESGADVTWGCEQIAAKPEKARDAFPVPRSKGWKADGTIADGEYGALRKLDRDARGCHLGAAPTLVQVAYDDEALLVAFKAADFWTTPLVKSEDGLGDAVRFEVGGRKFVAFYTGKVYAEDGNGARTPLAAAVCKEVRGGMARLHVIECRIPFRDLGIVPKEGLTIPFNASRYTSFYRETRWYSAPGGEAAKLVLQ